MRARGVLRAAELGTGELSAEALARLARPDPPVTHAMPDLADRSAAGVAAVAAWRAAEHESWGEGVEAGEPAHVAVRVAGVPCLRADGPDADDPGRVTVLYLHGGGYCLGSPGVAVPITARLARFVDVVSVDYRLAPEHPHPAGLDDAWAVYLALARQGPVALAGDSAGGGLALGVALRSVAAGRDPGQRERPRPPVALLLLCPHLDHAVPARGGPAGAEVAAMSAAYLAGRDPLEPDVSPLRARSKLLAGLAPTLVQTGSADHLFRQAARFARRARGAGAPVTLDVWDGLWHTWHYHRGLPEADAALAEAAAFLRAASQVEVAEAARRSSAR